MMARPSTILDIAASPPRRLGCPLFAAGSGCIEVVMTREGVHGMQWLQQADRRPKQPVEMISSKSKMDVPHGARNGLDLSSRSMARSASSPESVVAKPRVSTVGAPWRCASPAPLPTDLSPFFRPSSIVLCVQWGKLQIAEPATIHSNCGVTLLYLPQIACRKARHVCFSSVRPCFQCDYTNEVTSHHCCLTPRMAYSHAKLHLGSDPTFVGHPGALDAAPTSSRGSVLS
ncbi:hypothetical protein B0J11DRAFT_216806 [Dendryphion nanum]|uniref:Uncharacterized protein n=1 Tax=Dendryphion nanum TaxID=256645 RepID=A0A9P9E649_9PLEO|nr:hypothetical protein B0J11DRAFT_216806 [Dendryphion nanum]